MTHKDKVRSVIWGLEEKLVAGSGKTSRFTKNITQITLNISNTLGVDVSAAIERG